MKTILVLHVTREAQSASPHVQPAAALAALFDGRLHGFQATAGVAVGQFVATLNPKVTLLCGEVPDAAIAARIAGGVRGIPCVSGDARFLTRSGYYEGIVRRIISRSNYNLDTAAKGIITWQGASKVIGGPDFQVRADFQALWSVLPGLVAWVGGYEDSEFPFDTRPLRHVLDCGGTSEEEALRIAHRLCVGRDWEKVTASWPPMFPVIPNQPLRKTPPEMPSISPVEMPSQNIVEFPRPLPVEFPTQSPPEIFLPLRHAKEPTAEATDRPSLFARVRRALKR